MIDNFSQNLSQGDLFVKVLCLSLSALVASVAAIVFYAPYIGVTKRNGVFVALATLLLAGGVGIMRAIATETHPLTVQYGPWHENDGFLVAECSFLFVMAVVPFLGKLFVELGNANADGTHKTRGARGTAGRWPGVGDVILTTSMAVFGSGAFGISILTTLGICAAVLAIPAILYSGEEPPKVADNIEHAASRERILQMLADGKITAEDSIGLLNAIGASTASQQTSEPARGRKLLFLGAALVLVGFFLPWFNIKISSYYAEAASAQGLPSFARFLPQVQAQQMQSVMSRSEGDMWKINFSGGDMNYGLGWIVLVLAALAAALPHLALRIDRQTERTITLLALGVGAVIIVYVITEASRASALLSGHEQQGMEMSFGIGAGVVLAACGYFFAFLGELRNGRRRFAAA